jgi:hypothetical protein
VNWKPALVAAVVVIAAGAATGIAVGGKTKTVTTTETQTVAQATPTTVTPPESTPTTTTPTTGTTATAPPADGRPPKYLVDTEEDVNETNLSIENRSAKIGGESFPDSVVAYTDPPSTVEYSTDGYGQFKASLGFEPEHTDSNMQATLTIFKDQKRGEKLYGPKSFDGPGKPVPVEFPTRGATKLVFSFTRDSEDFAPDNAFVLGSARFEP